jgi:agmatinase
VNFVTEHPTFRSSFAGIILNADAVKACGNNAIIAHSSKEYGRNDMTFARTVRFVVLVALLVSAASPALAQSMLGHEYELEAVPIREGEEPVIPLDTGDPSYNLWRQLRDLSEDPAREPGIINIQKYNFALSYNAMPTFFHLPVAMSPADLEASQVDVAIMGAVPDMGTGMRGAAHGPNAVRNSNVYGGYGTRQPHMHTMVDPLEELVVADFGNAPIDIMSTERSVHAIRSFVRSAAEVEIRPGERVIPIIVGGDHSLMYPDVAALTDVYGKGNVGVIHFDAHYDAGKYMQGHLISHGMPVYRLIEEGLVPGKNFIQVALRGYYPDETAFEWMRKQGFRYHTMAEIERRGFDGDRAPRLRCGHGRRDPRGSGGT